jgi:quercetin dioxygenase-like cupin family protein
MNYIDPVGVSPGNYRSLFENEHVRVVEMGLGAGEIDEWHSHPFETVYFVRGGKLRVHLREGEPAELEVPDGGVIWHEPWTHRVENAGSSDVLAIIVEDKQKRT